MSRIKRASAIVTITAYLGVLFYGLACHAVSYRVASHPLMYFIVWDMFCGWSAYESRTQIIGEGESGAYYQLSPPPWGEYHPYGNLGRQHYDSFARFGGAMATNTLKHTQHEPILRVFVIEENWAKKYNLPDPLWNQLAGGPREPHTYCHVQSVWSASGELLQMNTPWYAVQGHWSVSDNPRLQADARRGRPVYALNPSTRINEMTETMPMEPVPGATHMHVGSPLGN